MGGWMRGQKKYKREKDTREDAKYTQSLSFHFFLPTKSSHHLTAGALPPAPAPPPLLLLSARTVLRLILMVNEQEGTAGATSACTVEVMPRFSKAPLINPQGKFRTVAAARRVASSSAVKGNNHRNLLSRSTKTPWLLVWSLSIYRA